MSISLFTPEESEAVKSSWKKITENGVGVVGQIILHRFFNDVPEIRPLFYNIGVDDHDPSTYTMENLKKNETFRSHAQRVASAIGACVRDLDDTDKIVAMCTELGKEHVTHKVEPHHFDQLGQVVVGVLCSALNVEVNDPTIQAWIKAYGAIAGAAKSGLMG